MPATIRDIKNQTGLSLATISKYLNGGNVLPENRVKIEKAISDLNYQVNELARGLVTNKSRTVGVSVHDIGSIFCGILLRHIGDILKRDGYSMIICDARDDVKREAENIEFFINKKVDGIIIIPTSKDRDFLKPALDNDVPVVLLDRSINGSECDCVRIDNRSAAALAGDFLLNKGHKKVGIIYSEEEYTGIERYKGFVETMSEAGISIPEKYRIAGTHSIEHGFKGMNMLLSKKDRPTAVFTTNYELTLGSVMAVNESRYCCPDDISIIGFDNLILSHVVQPKMTMVVQPMKEMGEKAAEIVLSKINGKHEEAPMEYVFNTSIEVGNSVRNM